MPHYHSFPSGLRRYAVLGAIGAASLTVGVAVTVAGADSEATADPAVAGPMSTTLATSSTTPGPSGGVGVVDEVMSPSPSPTSAPAEPPAIDDPTTGDSAPEDEVGETVDGPEGIGEPGPSGPDWTDDDGNEGGGAVPLDPVVIGPCDALAGDEQQFIIPATVEIASGADAGELIVTNCSDAPLPVEFDSANGLDIAVDAADLPPGESSYAFSVDAGSLDVGAFELAFKVTQTGCCADYGDVLGFKQGFDPDLALDLDLAAGAGQGGCKAGCITSAWIEGNQLHTSVDLHVTTRVPAEISAYVSTQAPVANQDGHPWMPGVAPSVTGDETTELDGVIAGLDEDTTYHIVIRAVDDNGVSTYADTFHTVTPLDHPGGFQGNDPTPGCSTGCIVHAMVDAPAHDRAQLTVRTSMPAQLEAWIGTTAPTTTDAVPGLPDAIEHYQTPDGWTDWVLDMSNLTGGTTYHVVVRATDANGRRDHQVGSFTTPPTPDVPVRISIDRIDLRDSGDLIGKGEVRFGFAYDGSLIGTRSEQKLDDRATVWVDAYNFVYVDLGPDEETRSFALWAGERDASLAGFCEAPLVGLACHGINWNVAFTGGVTLAEMAALPPCEDYGFEGDAADDRCLVITDVGGIGDEPRFDAVVRYRVG